MLPSRRKRGADKEVVFIECKKKLSNYILLNRCTLTGLQGQRALRSRLEFLLNNCHRAPYKADRELHFFQNPGRYARSLFAFFFLFLSFFARNGSSGFRYYFFSPQFFFFTRANKSHMITNLQRGFTLFLFSFLQEFLCDLRNTHNTRRLVKFVNASSAIVCKRFRRSNLKRITNYERRISRAFVLVLTTLQDW